MYGNGAIFILHPCILSRIQDNFLVIQTCQWSDIKICSIDKANFSKEWTCLRHLLISHKVISAGFCLECRYS